MTNGPDYSCITPDERRDILRYLCSGIAHLRTTRVVLTNDLIGVAKHLADRPQAVIAYARILDLIIPRNAQGDRVSGWVEARQRDPFHPDRMMLPPAWAHDLAPLREELADAWNKAHRG